MHKVLEGAAPRRVARTLYNMQPNAMTVNNAGDESMRSLMALSAVAALWLCVSCPAAESQPASQPRTASQSRPPIAAASASASAPASRPRRSSPTPTRWNSRSSSHRWVTMYTRSARPPTSAWRPCAPASSRAGALRQPRNPGDQRQARGPVHPLRVPAARGDRLQPRPSRQRLGLKTGDVIVKVDDKPIADNIALKELYKQCVTNCTFTVLRRGEILDIQDEGIACIRHDIVPGTSFWRADVGGNDHCRGLVDWRRQPR